MKEDFADDLNRMSMVKIKAKNAAEQAERDRRMFRLGAEWQRERDAMFVHERFSFSLAQLVEAQPITSADVQAALEGK